MKGTNGPKRREEETRRGARAENLLQRTSVSPTGGLVLWKSSPTAAKNVAIVPENETKRNETKIKTYF
jgi:hypothetical protein